LSGLGGWACTLVQRSLALTTRPSSLMPAPGSSLPACPARVVHLSALVRPALPPPSLAPPSHRPPAPGRGGQRERRPRLAAPPGQGPRREGVPPARAAARAVRLRGLALRQGGGWQVHIMHASRLGVRQGGGWQGSKASWAAWRVHIMPCPVGLQGLQGDRRLLDLAAALVKTQPGWCSGCPTCQGPGAACAAATLSNSWLHRPVGS
jgi:hypothetical protein